MLIIIIITYAHIYARVSADVDPELQLLVTTAGPVTAI